VRAQFSPRDFQLLIKRRLLAELSGRIRARGTQAPRAIERRLSGPAWSFRAEAEFD